MPPCGATSCWPKPNSTCSPSSSPCSSSADRCGSCGAAATFPTDAGRRARSALPGAGRARPISGCSSASWRRWPGASAPPPAPTGRSGCCSSTAARSVVTSPSSAATSATTCSVCRSLPSSVHGCASCSSSPSSSRCSPRRSPVSCAGRGATRIAGAARSSALAQLVVLAAVLAIVQALDDIFVRRPMQAVSPSGSFVGAGFTELNVVVRAAWLLGVLAIATGLSLVIAAQRRRWRRRSRRRRRGGGRPPRRLRGDPWRRRPVRRRTRRGGPPTALSRPQPHSDASRISARRRRRHGSPARRRHRRPRPGVRRSGRPHTAVGRHPAGSCAAGAARPHRRRGSPISISTATRSTVNPRPVMVAARSASRNDLPGARLGPRAPRLHPR